MQDNYKPSIVKNNIYIYRNQLLQRKKFDNEFFNYYIGINKFIEKRVVHKSDDLKMKGMFGFEYDDYSLPYLVMVIIIYALTLSSIFM